MNNKKILNYFLSKTINNFNYCNTIKTKLNNKFIILYRFSSPKQHKTINLLFQTVNLSFQTVNLSFCVVLSIIDNQKMHALFAALGFASCMPAGMIYGKQAGKIVIVL